MQFVEHYYQHGDPAAAYVAAFGATPNAEQRGRSLAKRGAVREVLAALFTRRVNALLEYDITPEATIREVAKIAFSDVRHYLRDDGSLLPISQISENATAALAGLELSTRDEGEAGGVTRVTKLKQWDKIGALKLLSELLGMRIQRTENVSAAGEFRMTFHLPDDVDPLS